MSFLEERARDKLQRKRDESLLGGGKDRIAAQHQKGKLSARERIDVLLDEGSFEEIGALVTHRTSRVRPGKAAHSRRWRRNRTGDYRRAPCLSV